jgi:hypothetical protein
MGFDSISTEERIQQDMERTMRARRRNEARKFAQASKAAEQAAQVGRQHARRPSIVVGSQQPAVRMVETVKKGRSWFCPCVDW